MGYKKVRPVTGRCVPNLRFLFSSWHTEWAIMLCTVEPDEKTEWSDPSYWRTRSSNDCARARLPKKKNARHQRGCVLPGHHEIEEPTRLKVPAAKRPCELQNSARTEPDSRGVRPPCDAGSCFGQSCGQSFHTDPTDLNPALSQQTRPCQSEGVRRASKLPSCASLTRFSVFTLAGGVGCRHPIPAASCASPRL